MDDVVIEILPEGRSGTICYREGPDHAHEFYWELGAGEVVAWTSVPTPDEWPTALPWAADRREAVLTLVAAEACRQRGPGCRVRVIAGALELLEPAA